MKFHCVHCERLIGLEDFWLEGKILVARCPACGKESRAERAGSGSDSRVRPPSTDTTPMPPPDPLSTPVPAIAEVPTAVPEGFCPKCIQPQGASGEVCPYCGLVYE